MQPLLTGKTAQTCIMLKDIITYIDKPSLLNENTVIDLTLIAEKYPYFQTAQLLRIKNLFNLSPEAIKPVLNFTAAYVTDRKILYYLLHPIKEEKTGTEEKLSRDEGHKPAKSPEKDVKDTIEENISDTLNNQITYLQQNNDDAIEFSTSIDVKKEYGDGVDLEQYVVRITESGPELIELLDEKNDKSDNKNRNLNTPPDDFKDNNKKPEEDILTLINKGVSAEKVVENEMFELTENQKKHHSIIDSFIKANPKIKPDNPVRSEPEDISEESVKENEHLITDTLANIYLKQGNYAKAIFAYEKLCLKYPEKSVYFAGQITEIKKLIEKSK